MSNPEVLIVGAGPTGLLLALWLTRLGVRVHLVDKAAEPGTTSRVLGMHGGHAVLPSTAEGMASWAVSGLNAAALADFARLLGACAGAGAAVVTGTRAAPSSTGAPGRQVRGNCSRPPVRPAGRPLAAGLVQPHSALLRHRA
jgi:2-polyprenyl-6-methoxyphenol hydroxylase-like FAD-dependent oxidoreductase